MNKPTRIIENGKHVGEILLDELLSAGVISESRHKIISTHQMITESTDTNDTIYYRSRATGTQRPVHRDRFEQVWADVKNYQSREDIAAALGFVPEDFGDEPRKRQATMTKFINRTVNKFNKNALEGDEYLPNFSKRTAHYTKKSSGDDEWDFGDPTLDDIDGGSRSRRGRETRTLQKINSQELLDGEFYSNMTRIPKTRWGSWLRFWDRKKSSVATDKSLLGREWGKSFILGYQVERNLLYEIWYNSIDSTFTVHDKNGTEMSGRVKTMSEAIRNMIAQVAQTSTSDAEVFRGNTPQSRQLAQSIQRSLYQDLDARAEELQAIEKKKQKETRAKRMKEISKRREVSRQAQRDFREFRKTFSDVSPDEIGADPQDKDNDPSTQSGQKDYDIKGDPTKADRDRMDKTMADYEKEENNRRAQMDKEASEQRMKRMVRDIPKYGEDDDDLGVDVPEFVSDKDKRKLAREKKRREKEAKKRSKGVSKTGQKSTETPEERQKRIEKELAANRKKVQDQIKKDNETREMNESNIEMGDDDASLEDTLKAETDNSRYDAQIRKIREDAERSPYTQMALKSSASGLVNYYTETKVKRNFGKNVLLRNLGRGRSEKIVLPTDKPSIWERVKMAFQGTRYRADFIIGWSLGEKVDIEIWYVTEPHPEYTGKQGQQKTLASFYVFDVTSGTLIRSYIPYYRQAIQIVMSKITAF